MIFGYYVLVFITGACVLIIEIAGTRLIAPIFGATIYVWSSLITVTLAALAIGYAVGGNLADRRKDRLASLASLLAIAGSWLFIAYWVRRPVLLTSAKLGVQAGALAGAGLLLGVPLFCLGAVGPLCVRLKTQTLDRLGRTVGSIYAVSTMGSVLGALVAGFWLIPKMRLSLMMAILSALLWALAAVCFWVSNQKQAKMYSTFCLLGVLAAFGMFFSRGGPKPYTLKFSAQSYYGDIRVMDLANFGTRVLFVDAIPNTVVKRDSLESVSDYIKAIELVSFMRPKGKKALLIGLGGGTLVGRLAKHYGIVTDVVDIDPIMIQVAREWFGFKPTGRFYLEDGRSYLERGKGSYDFIVLDAFNGDQHPYHLFSKEAFSAARRNLAKGGILSINLIGYAKGPKASLMRSALKTLGEVFPYTRVISANTKLDMHKSYVNLIFYASDAPLDFQRDPFGARSELATYYSKVALQFTDFGDSFFKTSKLMRADIITDDFNPVEFLSAPAFLEIRQLILKSAGDFLRE